MSDLVIHQSAFGLLADCSYCKKHVACWGYYVKDSDVWARLCSQCLQPYPLTRGRDFHDFTPILLSPEKTQRAKELMQL